ncbi:MAG TPA: hypothetical protein PLI77_00260 [Bacteroidales bacterium]|nr:hypothetical protein [Bacteroidales bacterium]
MKDRKPTTIPVEEAFGTIKKYQVFAVKSNQNLIPFVVSFEKMIQSSFTFLTDFEVNPNQHAAHFNVMYALLSKEDQIHCCIMENKTTNYSSDTSISSNKEKNLPFQTLSLFDDMLYLINSEGFKIFKADVKDYDYLIFIFADKEKIITPYINVFQSYQPFRTIDISYLLEPSAKKEHKNGKLFLQNCFCNFEIKITKFNKQKLLTRLGPQNKIPKENLQYSYKIEIDETITDNLTQNVNDDYLKFLTHEVDSL